MYYTCLRYFSLHLINLIISLSFLDRKILNLESFHFSVAAVHYLLSLREGLKKKALGKVMTFSKLRFEIGVAKVDQELTKSTKRGHGGEEPPAEEEAPQRAGSRLSLGDDADLQRARKRRVRTPSGGPNPFQTPKGKGKDGRST